MIRILVAEDDTAMNKLICSMLAEKGYEPLPCFDGAQAISAYENQPVDMVITDVMMPKADGYELAQEVRRQDRHIPILFMTALDDKISQQRGFRSGADDYVTKPFSPKEVMARINAVTKRRAMKNNDVSQQSYKFEGLEIDMAGRNVYVDGEKAELTPKEYELLFYLVRNKGIALTREKLLYDVWGFDFYGDDRTVDTHIKMLRGNLKEYRKFIVTLRGLGYKFEV